jgi:hypothetical protein
MNEYDPDIHHRRSIRLKEYDYSLEGLYFVTICVQHVGAKNFSPVQPSRNAVGAKNFSPVQPSHLPMHPSCNAVGAKNFSPVQSNNHSPVQGTHYIRPHLFGDVVNG